MLLATSFSKKERETSPFFYGICIPIMIVYTANSITVNKVKADKPEVTITFSDWKNDREMGGAAGERRVLNFIQCTPYYAE